MVNISKLDISRVENSSDNEISRKRRKGPMISGKTGAWRRRIDLFALERGGGGDGGFIGLSIANLSASVRYRTI